MGFSGGENWGKGCVVQAQPHLTEAKLGGVMSQVQARCRPRAADPYGARPVTGLGQKIPPFLSYWSAPRFWRLRPPSLCYTLFTRQRPEGKAGGDSGATGALALGWLPLLTRSENEAGKRPASRFGGHRRLPPRTLSPGVLGGVRSFSLPRAGPGDGAGVRCPRQVPTARPCRNVVLPASPCERRLKEECSYVCITHLSEQMLLR